MTAERDPRDPRGMGGRRTLSLLVYPSDDETLATVVRELILDPAISTPADLQELLRPLHPAIVVRGREIAAESFDTWYVYRDGSFAAPVDRGEWWTSSDVATVLYDKDGRVVAVNETFAHLVRAADDRSLVGRSYLDFVAPGAAVPFRLVFQHVLAGQPASSTAAWLRVDGSTIDVEHRTWLAPDGIRSALRPLPSANRPDERAGTTGAATGSP